MEYMPGAASLAANHKGKLKNLRLATLRESGLPPETCIITLEKTIKQHDANLARSTGNPAHLAEYREIGHPYQRNYSLSPSLTWVLCMSPLMSKIFAATDFVEIDVTYKAAVELQYLLNVVAFNYTTMQC